MKTQAQYYRLGCDVNIFGRKKKITNEGMKEGMRQGRREESWVQILTLVNLGRFFDLSRLLISVKRGCGLFLDYEVTYAKDVFFSFPPGNSSEVPFRIVLNSHFTSHSHGSPPPLTFKGETSGTLKLPNGRCF